MDKIFTIFGGTGIVGRYVTWNLAKLGCTINIVTRSENRASFLKTYGLPGKIGITVADIMNYTQLTSLIKMSDIVINCIEGSYHNKSHALYSSLPGLIADYCNKYDTEKYIHLSSLFSNSKINKIKKEGEDKVREKIKDKSTIIRSGHIFANESRYINSLCQIASFPFCIFPRENKNTWIYPTLATDIADIIVKCIENRDTNGKVFDITSASPLKTDNLTKKVFAFLDKCPRQIYISDKIACFSTFITNKFPSNFFKIINQSLINIGCEKIEIDKIYNSGYFGVKIKPLEEILKQICWGSRGEGIIQSKTQSDYY